MKSISSALSTLFNSTDIRAPIAKIELYETPWVCSSYGINVVGYRDLNTTGTVVFGQSIDASYDVLTDSGVMVTNAVWDSYGFDRPFNFDSDDDLTLVYEGYVYAKEADIDFKLICNTSGTVNVSTSGGIYPSQVTNQVVSYVATGNADATEAATGSVSATGAGVWVPFQVKHYMPAGTVGKMTLLYKYGSESQYRVFDVSNANTTGAFLTPINISGVNSLRGTLRDETAGTVQFRVTKDGGYTYDSQTDSYGDLRIGRHIQVFAGANTNYSPTGYVAPDSTDYVSMGHYLIDDVQLDKSAGVEEIVVNAVDARAIAAATINVPLLPALHTYDALELNSDAVFDETDGLNRYAGFDSWKFSDAIRVLLLHSCFTSDQVWATDSNGDYKISAFADDIRLDRTDLFRLKLGDVEKYDQDLQYSYGPEKKLLDIIRELVEQYNYEFLIDSEGDPVLRRKANSVVFLAEEGDVSTASKTDDVESLGGAYYSVTGGSVTYTLNSTHTGSQKYKGAAVVFNRPVSVATDYITSIKKNAVEQLTGIVDIGYDYVWKYRWGLDPAANFNPCVIEAFRGKTSSTDTITCTAFGAEADFQGWILYDDDPEEVDLTFTSTHVERLSVNQSARDTRNDVVVVGAEKGFDTDEFFTSRTLDAKSIMNPASANFIGRRQKLVIPQRGVRRQDVLDNVSFTEALRHQKFTDNVGFSIPFRPDLEVRDTIRITDATAGTSGENFYVNEISWSIGRDPQPLAAMQVRVDGLKPLQSFQPIRQPIAPTNTVDNFLVSRTDGGDITPNTDTSNGADTVETGYYNPIWDTNQTPPVRLAVDFDLFANAYVTLAVKDLYTNKTLALLEQDNFLEYGKHHYEWNGRVWNDDHSEYRLYPNDPALDGNSWNDQQEQEEFFDSTVNRNRTGYVYFELDYVEADDRTARGHQMASNASATGLGYVKVKLGGKGSVAVTRDDQPISGTGLSIDVSDRWDVYDNVWSASGGPYGVRYKVEHTGEPMQLYFGGYLDAYILLIKDTGASPSAFTSTGDILMKAQQTFDVESLAVGQQLYKINPNDVSDFTLINPVTELLSTGAREFVLDYTNLQVKSEDWFVGEFVRDYRDPTFNNGFLPTKAARDRYPRRQLRFRNGYLEELAKLYPNFDAIGAAFYVNFTVSGVNAAGETVFSDTIGPLRMEDPSYTGGKYHGIWPPTDVQQNTYINIPSGTYARTRDYLDDDTQLLVNRDKEKIVHFTFNTQFSGTYD